MLKSINPTQTNSWHKLQTHFNAMSSVQMKQLFDADPERFDKFSAQFNAYTY